MGRRARRESRLSLAAAVPPWAWGAIGLALGAIAGSYLATLILRWPRGGRTRAGRSRCDSCAHALAPVDLVPLLSYAFRRGRCRYCRAPIDPRHPLIEALAAAIGLIAFIAVPGPQGLLAAMFGWLLLALAMLDFDHLWLPDRLTGLLGLAGLAAGLAGFAPPLAERLLGGCVGYGVLALIAWLYRRMRGREGLGAGDAKLLGAIGLWTGWPVLPFILLGASVAGLAGVLICRLAGRRIGAATPLPFGTCLAAAAWPVWLFAVLR